MAKQTQYTCDLCSKKVSEPHNGRQIFGFDLYQADRDKADLRIAKDCNTATLHICRMCVNVINTVASEAALP